MTAGSAPGPAARLAAALVLAASMVALPGCDGDERETETISPERFVTVFVDLRLAARGAEGDTIPAARRDSILSAHGVTPADLLEFARVRGRDPSRMSAVWDSVELRLLRAADTTGGDDGG